MFAKNLYKKSSVLIVGAGPMGLSAAVHLCAAGAEVYVHGVPMEAWKEKMPAGMNLRSTRESSNIASPGEELSIDHFERQTSMQVGFHPTIAQFNTYGQWFQEKGVPNVDRTKVKSICAHGNGFTATLEDGRELHTGTAVLATGIIPYPYKPEEFTSIPKSLASHSSENVPFDLLENKEVIVIGKGQSALESAALLHECGAKVEILTRGSRLRFIENGTDEVFWKRLLSIPRIHEFLYPPTDLAGPPFNWAIADPIIYRGLSKSEQAILFDLIGPIGSTDLQARLASVPVTFNVKVKQAAERGDRIRLDLSDGSSREADHVLLATGFKPDIHRCEYLCEDLRTALELEDGYPRLTQGYESTSVKGLYFAGALACKSLGPINRFVCGTYPMAQHLTEDITGSRIGYPNQRTKNDVAGRRFLFKVFQLSGKTTKKPAVMD